MGFQFRPERNQTGNYDLNDIDIIVNLLRFVYQIAEEVDG
jgi:hypothetical protein